MRNGRLLVGVAIPFVLVLAIGLASWGWKTQARFTSAFSTPLSSAPVALPTVALAGLLDGLNPCAFTVLLLFVATVASLYGGVGGTGAMRDRLFLYGGAFILAIFATYLSIGAGLMRVSTALTQNHLGARLGALVAVFLGLWMMKDFFMPGWGPRLGAPRSVGNLVQRWGRRASLMSMLGLGVLVGLCTVPCSGAVYLAILSMLALQQSFVLAYLYLVLYNVVFVIPLVALLVAASARPVLNRLAHWNLHYRERVRLGLGAGVVALGLAILATV
ncbi:hypothetical protein HRbin23_00028 [bacterium HR23]|nr:hypothetical protein HRbin23_00028 [bacterium HR23]